MSTSLDISLDEIISNKRAAKKAEVKNKKKTNIPRRSNGIVKAARQEMNKKKPTFARQMPLQNGARSVRINIWNLAPTVVSCDLYDLFTDCRLRNATVHFDEHGKPLGTGQLTLSKLDADRLIAKFTGVTLDKKLMKFALESPITDRYLPPIVRNIRPGPVRRKQFRPTNSSNSHEKKQKKTFKKSSRSKYSAEQLDAELDAYMARE